MPERTCTITDETEPVANEILEIIERWAPIIGLDQWRRYVDWSEDSTVASCIAHPRYRQWLVNFDLDKTTDPQRCANLEELVVHEMTHALHWKAWDYADMLQKALSASLGLKGKTKEAFVAMHEHFIQETMEEQASLMGWAIYRAAGNEVPEPTFNLRGINTPGVHAPYNPRPIKHEVDGEDSGSGN